MKHLLSLTTGILIFLASIAPIATAAKSDTFPDIANHPYRESIEFVKLFGIVDGYPDGTYRPNDTVLRAELLKFTLDNNIYGSNFDEYADDGCFPDVTPDLWFAGRACFAASKGFIKGYPDGTFKGYKPVNLVEAAKIVSTTYREPFNVIFDSETFFTGDPWFKNVIEYFGDTANLLPPNMQNFDQPIKRGEVAELITRLKRFQVGELENHPGYTPKVHVTFESLKEGRNLQEEFFGNKIFEIEGREIEADSSLRVSRTMDTHFHGFVETETPEGHRVTLNSPPGAMAVTQVVSLSPLTAIPLDYKLANFLDNGVFVDVRYGFSQRDYGWLIYDFSPEEKVINPERPWDYCAARRNSFSITQCLSSRKKSFTRDDLTFVTVNNKWLSDVSLAPTFKIDEDVYAVKLRHSGAYIPVRLTANEARSFAEQTADLHPKKPEKLIEAARLLAFHNVVPGQKLQTKLEDLNNKVFYHPEDFVNGLQIANHFGLSSVEDSLRAKFDDDLKRFSGGGITDFDLYLAAIAVANRDGYTNLPSLTSDPLIQKAVTDAFNSNNISTKKNGITSLSEILRTTDHISRYKISFLLELVIPTAYANGWIDNFTESVEGYLENELDKFNGFDDYLEIAEIAYEWGLDDVGDESIEKAKKLLAEAVAIAPAPGDGEECDLIRKTLANYAINNCTNSAAVDLIDLAEKAQALGADETADAALRKAGITP